MKIIKKGTRAEFKPFPCACDRCDSELLIESLGDLWRYSYSDPRERDQEDYLYVVCPVCNGRIQLLKSVIPPHLFWKVKTD